jgi:exopolysaccharide biosynthesis predicted pyruvyltransferase EpsI
VQVLDPTLLVEQQLWDKCIKIVKLKTPYILLFRIAVNEELYNVANTIAQQIHLPVIYLNYHAFTVLDHSNKPKRYCFKNVRCAGPKEFVTLFKNAKFIVTNSFHGTAFSIIFNKNFVVIPDKNRGNRVTNLLNMLELSERIINNHNQISENFNFEVDYKTANEILNKQKEKSFTFLKKVLET